MNIKELEVFVTLAQTLHFGRTAERHSLSAPTLSRAVKRMEEAAGVVLLERDNRKVSLTEAGRAYADFARSTLSGWSEFKAQTQGQNEAVEGEVGLFCSVTASHRLLSPLLTRLRTRFPGVDIRVHTGDQAGSLKRLRDESEDFVIAARPDELPANTLFKRLSADELVFIAPGEGPIAHKLSAASPGWGDLPWVLAERLALRDEYCANQLGVVDEVRRVRPHAELGEASSACSDGLERPQGVAGDMPQKAEAQETGIDALGVHGRASS